MRFNRRYFLRTTTATAAACLAGQDVLAAEEQPVPHSHYQRANTDWLAKCRFGIGTHWTAQTVPRNGPPKPFQKAVDDFDLDGFIKTVEDAGADYVLFTSAHALQMLPAPHPVLDKILPGRTCKRDLIRELADGLAAKGKHFLVYYNHSCNHNQDPEWEQAVGYHARNKERFAQNIMDIVGHMGQRYKEKIKAWWFDSPYSLDPRGPHNSVTTDMTGFPVSLGAVYGGRQAGISSATCDLQRRGQPDLSVHDTPRLLGWRIGESEHATEGPLPG